MGRQLDVQEFLALYRAQLGRLAVDPYDVHRIGEIIQDSALLGLDRGPQNRERMVWLDGQDEGPQGVLLGLSVRPPVLECYAASVAADDLDLGLGAETDPLPAESLGKGGHIGRIVHLEDLHGLALFAGLGLARVEARWPQLPVAVLGSLVLLGQLWVGRWSPEEWTPLEESEPAGAELLTRIGELEGSVLAPHTPWYPVLAGKDPGLHLIALWDIDHKDCSLRPHVGEIREALADQRWDAVIVANQKFGFGLEKGYRRAETLSPGGRALYPLTGWGVRARYLYLPKPAAAAPTPQAETGEADEEQVHVGLEGRKCPMVPPRVVLPQ